MTLQKNIKARIMATGYYYPKRVILNKDLETIMDTNDEWIVQRTGVNQRYYSDENTSYLAYNAAINALSNSNIDKDDLDLILVCTCTPDNFSPSVANIVQKKLKLKKDIPSFDINAACSGFIYGLKIAQAMIESKMYENILLIGAENLSKLINFEDRSTAILFGDGAGAIILSAKETGIIDTYISNKDDVEEAILIGNNVAVDNPFIKDKQEAIFSKIQMKGQNVFKFATSTCVRMIKKIMKDNNLSLDDIDYIIPHQANLRIIDYAIKVLKINASKVITNVENTGNTSSASIPIVLAKLNEKKLLNRKQKIIVVAFGGGLTYGVSLIEF